LELPEQDQALTETAATHIHIDKDTKYMHATCGCE